MEVSQVWNGVWPAVHSLNQGKSNQHLYSLMWTALFERYQELDSDRPDGFLKYPKYLLKVTFGSTLKALNVSKIFLAKNVKSFQNKLLTEEGEPEYL